MADESRTSKDLYLEICNHPAWNELTSLNHRDWRGRLSPFTNVKILEDIKVQLDSYRSADNPNVKAQLAQQIRKSLSRKRRSPIEHEIRAEALEAARRERVRNVAEASLEAEAAREAAEAARAEAKWLLEEITAKENQVKDLEKRLAEASLAATKKGVEVHEENFSELCKENRWQARWWAVMVATIAMGALIYIFYVVERKPATGPRFPSTGVIIQTMVPRALAFSVLYFLMVWAARNYAAARHNQTINQHRLAALRSFDAFTSATEGDRDLRLAILKQVTTAIFETQLTGFIRDDGEKANFISVVTEAAKAPTAATQVK